MITDEERQSIINEAVEKALLALPDVVGNLIMNQTKLIKMNREFYQKFPDLAANKDLVAAVVERLEGGSPGTDYQELLNKAVPIIREEIKNTRGLDMKTVNRPNRNLASLNLTSESDHGEL